MTSMTSYAYKEVSSERMFILVEIKSVNSRFLDLNITLPPFLGRLEQDIRARCANRMLRGKVDVYIRVDSAYNTHNHYPKGLQARYISTPSRKVGDLCPYFS